MLHLTGQQSGKSCCDNPCACFQSWLSLHLVLQVVDSIVGTERLNRFDVILAGDDVTKKKPDPLIYNMARQRLGISADK